MRQKIITRLNTYSRRAIKRCRKTEDSDEFSKAIEAWEEEGAKATFEANFPNEDWDEFSKQFEKEKSKNGNNANK